MGIFPLLCRPAHLGRYIHVVDRLSSYVNIIEHTEQQPVKVPILHPSNDTRVKQLLFAGRIRW